MKDDISRRGVVPLRAATPAPADGRASGGKRARRTGAKPPEEELPQKRSRGRPSIGAIAPIRLNDEQRDFANRLGDDNLAEGVRKAIDFARSHTPGEQVEPQPEEVSLFVPSALAAAVKTIGNGSFNRGLGTLVKAAEVITHDAIRKLGKG